MTRTRAATYVRFLTIYALLGALGIGAVAYVLFKQRVRPPFQDVYAINVELADASGVSGGQGQPVNVAGVKVGQVTRVRLADGHASVTLQLERKLLPHVYRNATATLEPISPLKDMQIDLHPGRPPAPALADGATLGLRATSTPVPLDDLLSRLDVDTRDYLSALIAGVDQGTAGRADDIRRTLAALGPSAAQARLLTQALARRRVELARLVHNVAVIGRAATRDDRLATLVDAGNRTLDALATQDRSLRSTLGKLPPTLDATSETLQRVQPFAQQLTPTLDALTPAARGLPAALRGLAKVSDTGTPALQHHIRPLVREAQPLARQLRRAVDPLDASSPDVRGIGQTLNYFLNELAYNPRGDDEGFLFWLSWATHNINSVLSTGDVHGSVIRIMTILTCNGLQSNESLAPALSAIGTCPK